MPQAQISHGRYARRAYHQVMSLNAYRTFVTVCRLGSLSAAAAELGYTQSAVSRQIAGLEREVGAPLVERHARGIRPTAAGEAFRRHAQAAVNEAERGIRAAREARDGSPVRPLTVGATPSLAAGVAPAAMRRLIDAAGPLPWNLVPGLTGELHERTASGELDIAIVTDAPPGLPGEPRLEHRLLGTDEMVVVLPRHRAGAGGARRDAARGRDHPALGRSADARHLRGAAAP
jgi:DNA-binding transcriptional LysR family regulator